MQLQALKTAAEAYLKTARGQIETLASEEYLTQSGENGFFLLKQRPAAFTAF